MIKSITGLPLRPLNVSMRNSAVAGLMLVTLTLVGCGGTLSGAGPYKGDIESESQRTAYDLVDINANTIAPFMRPTAKPAKAQSTSPLAQTVRLMGGDVINVLITDNAPEGSGLFAPLSTGGTQLKVRIDDKGMISCRTLVINLLPA